MRRLPYVMSQRDVAEGYLQKMQVKELLPNTVELLQKLERKNTVRKLRNGGLPQSVCG